MSNWPVGRAVTRSSLDREVRGSNLGPIGQSVANGLPPLRKQVVLPGRNDAEMGPANSLHASA